MTKSFYLVHHEYVDGTNSYVETSIFHASEQQLERHVNEELEAFAGGKTTLWTFADGGEQVLEHDGQRALTVIAHELGSIESALGWLVTTI